LEECASAEETTEEEDWTEQLQSQVTWPQLCATTHSLLTHNYLVDTTDGDILLSISQG
jgi:hypothetical protein